MRNAIQSTISTVARIRRGLVVVAVKSVLRTLKQTRSFFFSPTASWPEPAAAYAAVRARAAAAHQAHQHLMHDSGCSMRRASIFAGGVC